MRDMSRAEAIEILKREHEILTNAGSYTKVSEALRLAIASLETDEAYQLEYERTTKNDLGVDAISRAKAIEEADKLCLETGYDNEKVIEMLNELTSVTPQEPRKGHWIGNYQVGFGEWQEYDVKLSDGFVTDNCHCSECGEELLSGDRGMFCPYCGSDNREVEE